MLLWASSCFVPFIFHFVYLLPVATNDEKFNEKSYFSTTIVIINIGIFVFLPIVFHNTFFFLDCLVIVMVHSFITSFTATCTLLVHAWTHTWKPINKINLYVTKCLYIYIYIHVYMYILIGILIITGGVLSVTLICDSSSNSGWGCLCFSLC